MSSGCDSARIKSALEVSKAAAPIGTGVKSPELNRLMLHVQSTSKLLRAAIRDDSGQADEHVETLHHALSGPLRSDLMNLRLVNELRSTKRCLRGVLRLPFFARAVLVPSPPTTANSFHRRVQSAPASMLSSRQCTGASTTGRIAHEFGDFVNVRSFDHSPRLSSPISHEHSAQICRKPLQPTLVSRRHSLTLQAVSGPRRHRQQQCCHSSIIACAASNTHAEFQSSRPPSICSTLRTAAVCAAVFAVWCCISANTQPGSAFASVASALTDAGAPPAGTLSHVTTT